MSSSQSIESLSPEPSQDSREPSEGIVETDAEEATTEPAQEPSERERKKRTTITHEIVTRFTNEYNKNSGASLKKIAETVGISYHTAKNLMRKIRLGDYNSGDKIVYFSVAKGRKPVRNEANERRVVEVLTQSTTMTLEKAKEVLAAENIRMSRATISRIAKDQKLSYQKTTSRAASVFTRDSNEKRHNYAVRVHEIPNNLIWYLDESGFNLHIVPDRSWAKKGKTPVQRVPANRQRNLSLLICIGHDGVKSYELRDGAFISKTFLVYIKRLAHRFPEVRHGRVTLVMDNARIHHAKCVVDYFDRKGIKYLYLPRTPRTSTRLRTSSAFSRRTTGAWAFRRPGIR